jgi:replicative DNA helicase
VSEKTIPADIEAEKATLGSVLLNREAIIAVAPWLMAEYFYLEKHAWIYEAMLACYAARIPPDTRTVSSELHRRERLETVGGISYLSELVDSVPTSYHVEYYARAVERTALYRRLIVAGGKIASLGYDTQDDLETTQADAQAVLNAALSRRGQGALIHVSQIASALYDAITARGEADSSVLTGTPSGLRDLDDILGGLQKQDLIVLAARPSVGKSGMALTIADYAARSGHTVVIFSLEMSHEQLVQRLTAMHSGESLHRVRHARLHDEALVRAIGALGQVGDLPLWIDETPAQSCAQIRGTALRFRAEHGPIGLVVVDYLQLMVAPSRDGNRVQEVSEISRALKALAKELDCPVLAISQLSRAVEGRQSHVPLLSDLRESGAIEQDADIVLFIYREEIYDRETDKKGVAELYIAKHRNGPVGVVPLRFDAATTSFHDLSYRTPDPVLVRRGGHGGAP